MMRGPAAVAVPALLALLYVGGVAANCLRLGRGAGGDRLGRVPGAGAGSNSSSSLTASLRAADEEELIKFLSGEYEKEASRLCNLANIAEWNFNTDLNNPSNEEEYVSISSTTTIPTELSTQLINLSVGVNLILSH